MIEDIWGRKPKVKTGHSIFHGYSAPEMDAWLKELFDYESNMKNEIADLEAQMEDLNRELDELTKKLDSQSMEESKQ